MKRSMKELADLVASACDRQVEVKTVTAGNDNPLVVETRLRAEGRADALLAVSDYVLNGDATSLRILGVDWSKEG